MEFPESYFEDEVREGFYVPSIMKKNWAAQLEVLEAVKLVCRKHNIEYFAEWGTMLGAVRHGGIIPWDDDIDICMKRKDYEKFLAVAEEELPEGFCIISSQNSDSMNLVTRVQNSSYPILLAEQMEQFHGFPYSMGIDVFVIDNLPKDEKIRKELHELAYSIAQVNTRLMAGNISLEELQRYLRDIERACQVTFDRTKPIGPQLIRTVEGLFKYFDERNSEELTAISIWLQNENYRLPKSFYQDAISIPFENTDIAVPVEYEALLNRKFVGYMTPVRMWNSHNYPGYQSQIELAKEAGVELLEYRFCREDMDAEKRLPKTSLKGRVMEFAPLFEEAHEELMHLAEMKDWENVRELLGECQNVALQLGTMVEEELGEDTTIVSILEQYCEQVFVVHQSLVQEGAFELKNMVSCMERFWSIVEDEIKEKRLVVFVPYQAKQWNTMNSLWQEAMADESTDVYVIPAPYYYKDVFGNCEKKIQYEDTGYPESIVLTSYEEFNFEIYHPDVLYIQCPYDQYNYAMTIHPFFYASNLRQYTEQLVYVPGLIMDEIDTGDERGRKMLKYYCNMPGVVYADKVLVQSEQMKQVYVELLTEFAGKDTKKLWEEKIVTANYSLADVKKVDFPVDIPTHWEEYIGKGDGQKKKVVLYTTSASALLHGGEAMIVKMKKVLETFYDNRDEVALIWRSDRAVREVLRKDNPKLWRQYSQLVQEYREAGWGIFDDSVDDTVARRLCDACYGDGGSTMNGCRVDGKPVMIQNIGV